MWGGGAGSKVLVICPKKRFFTASLIEFSNRFSPNGAKRTITHKNRSKCFWFTKKKSGQSGHVVVVVLFIAIAVVVASVVVVVVDIGSMHALIL